MVHVFSEVLTKVFRLQLTCITLQYTLQRVSHLHELAIGEQFEDLFADVCDFAFGSLGKLGQLELEPLILRYLILLLILKLYLRVAD